MLKTPAEMDAKEKVDKKAGFDKWMDQPATRMMMSMIPAGEKAEVLETLLQETFSAGFNAGAGKTIGMVVEALFKNMDKRMDGRPRSAFD